MLKLMTHNFSFKVLAIGCAAVTWLTVYAVTSRETVLMDIPVSVKAPDGWAVRNKSADTFDVTFRGSKDDLLKLDNQKIRVEVNFAKALLDEASTASHVFQLNGKNVIFPGSARVASIEPSSLEVTLDDGIVKQLDVHPSITGQLPPGIEIEDLIVMPATVRVEGSRHRLDPLTFIQTEAIDTTGREQSFEQRVNVLEPAEGSFTKIEPARVVVKVMLTEKIATRTMEGLVVNVLKGPGDQRAIKLTPEAAKVTVQGPEDLLNALEPGSLNVYVNCSEVISGTSLDLPVKVDLPENIEVIDIEPPLIKVHARD